MDPLLSGLRVRRTPGSLFGAGSASLRCFFQGARSRPVASTERKIERFGWTFAAGDKVMQVETTRCCSALAQFERELIGERVRDKIAASKRKGLWVGGPIPLGYATVNKKLVVVSQEAETVPALPPMRFGRSLGRGTDPPKDRVEGPHHSQRPHPGRQPV
jgi:hypothetical protein